MDPRRAVRQKNGMIYISQTELIRVQNTKKIKIYLHVPCMSEIRVIMVAKGKMRPSLPNFTIQSR